MKRFLVATVISCFLFATTAPQIASAGEYKPSEEIKVVSIAPVLVVFLLLNPFGIFGKKSGKTSEGGKTQKNKQKSKTK